jgi:hypothetical protein
MYLVIACLFACLAILDSVPVKLGASYQNGRLVLVTAPALPGVASILDDISSVELMGEDSDGDTDSDEDMLGWDSDMDEASEAALAQVLAMSALQHEQAQRAQSLELQALLEYLGGSVV